jgi:hypothetical protein
MSYFDAIQCKACGNRFDPEKLNVQRGQAMNCPKCGAALDLASLFGVSDAFRGIDDDENAALSLNDLSPEGQERPSWAGYGGTAPDPLKGAQPLGARQPKPPGARPATPPPKTPAKPAMKALPGGDKPWDNGRGHVVPTRKPDEDDAPAPVHEESGSQALDALRRMKDKKGRK